jgi:hypothetical protein
VSPADQLPLLIAEAEATIVCRAFTIAQLIKKAIIKESLTVVFEVKIMKFKFFHQGK